MMTMRYEIILKDENHEVLDSHKSRTLEGIAKHYKKMRNNMYSSDGNIFARYYHSSFTIIDHEDDHEIDEDMLYHFYCR